MGMLASVGIVKARPFAPDERVRKVLEDAVVVGNATARTIAFAPREKEGFAVYPGSWWINGLWAPRLRFLDPRRRSTPEGVVPSPSDGPASSTRASGSSIPPPASPRRCACA